MKGLFTPLNSIVKIVFIIFMTLQVSNAHASHIMGSDISWKNLENHKYEITLKLYRDCRGIPAYTDELTVRCASGNLGVLTFTLIRQEIIDITRVCDSLPNPCDPVNTITDKMGIEEHVFKGVLDFDSGDLLTMRNNGCCRFNLAFSECCRNQPSGMTISGGNFFTDAEIDLCNIDKSTMKYDNSPVFSNPPIRHICINTPVIYTNGSLETDGDSLTFSLVEALNNMGVNVNYKTPFSATWPMTSYCDTNGSPCSCDDSKYPLIEGFCFNNKSGEISFVPVFLEESGVIVVKVEQFRLDSAKKEWLNIGYVKRELQLVVLACNENNPPYLNKLNDTTICAGDSICMEITALDLQDSTGQIWQDSIDLTWDGGIPGAHFIPDNQFNDTINGNVFVVKNANICWQTDSVLGRNAPYLFTVTAIDRACPFKAITSRSYSIKVDPCLPPDTTGNNDTSKLNQVVFLVNNSLRIYPNPVSNILVLESESPISYIKVYDNLGKVVIEKQDPQTLDLSELKKGIYFLYGHDIHGNLLKNKVMKE